ncbi:MAG: RNA polymerase sigma factor [Lachnospiraceae bacterium]|nr:RNA polymerase sigma factor [Lachnospiraceae bacterium]
MSNKHKRETTQSETEEFKAVYLEYHNLVLKVAFNHIGDYHIAQDICQEVFFRLHLYFDSMAREKMKAWLVVVAANIARDLKKKGGKYRESVGLPETEELENLSDTSNNIEEFLERSDALLFCTEALAALREKNKTWYEVLILVECMEVPRKKIAEVHGVRLGTVDGYLRRAKKWLRRNYGDAYQDL